MSVPGGILVTEARTRSGAIGRTCSRGLGDFLICLGHFGTVGSVAAMAILDLV